jgi:gliding motility-associated-like protein
VPGEALEGPQVYLPTAFTPNGDRLNEKIKPICVGISRFDYFRIFDRFGKLIFETNKMGEGWDGYYKGKRQSSGNYISTVKVKDITGKEYIKTSNLLLMY